MENRTYFLKTNEACRFLGLVHAINGGSLVTPKNCLISGRLPGHGDPINGCVDSYFLFLAVFLGVGLKGFSVACIFPPVLQAKLDVSLSTDE